MRVSREEKERSHARIVEGAARMLRERGVEGISVAEVMAGAGLTNGGFYRHFETRDALVEEALDAAFEEMLASLAERFERLAPVAALAEYRGDYLSEGHLGSPGMGCPLPALGADIGRAAASLKARFGGFARRAIDLLARAMPGVARQRREAATRELAMLVGAVTIARASDPETARAVLAACRRAP